MSSTYDDFLRRLFEQNQFAIRYELDAMSAALARRGLGRPARTNVVVAGTNGKGTTTAALNAIALDAGMHTGLYTSPHLVDFRERIRVDGHPISVDACVRIGLDVFDEYSGRDRPAPAPRPLSYFELTTLLAARHFAEQGGLDLAVLEVGMGGRLDAVNAFDADACVITGVSLDHQEYLGDSVAAIAAEKVGIARQGVPLIVHAESGGFDEIVRLARARGVDCEVVTGGSTARERNIALAAAAFARTHGGDARDHATRASLRMRWPGRQQRIERPDAAPLWLDGAHNAESMAEHVRWLRREVLGHGQATFVVGTSPPRDPAELFAPLIPFASRFVVTRAATRGHDVERVAAALRARGAVRVETAPTAAHALAAAGADPTVVVGSLYLVGDILGALGCSADDLPVFA